MPKKKTWAQERADQIRRDAKARYGNAWHLMGDDARDNYVADQILMVIMTQALPEYRPAQDMARDLFKQFREA